MKRDLADVFAGCLDEIEAEKLALESCLARYPEHCEPLRDLVPLALELRGMPAGAPSETFRADSYEQLLQTIEKESRRSAPILDHLRSLGQAFSQLFPARVPAPGWIVVAILILWLVVSSGVTLASGYALPGDTLYPVKTVFEETQLALADDAGDVGLHMRFAERRIDEVAGLLEQERPQDAPVAIDRFESHVTQAVDRLSTVAQDDAVQAEQLAVEVRQTLVNQRSELIALGDRAPSPIQPTIQAASDFSKRTISTIWDLMPNQVLPDALQDPTEGTPSATHAPTDTPSPEPSDFPSWGPPQATPGAPSHTPPAMPQSSAPPPDAPATPLPRPSDTPPEGMPEETPELPPPPPQTTPSAPPPDAPATPLPRPSDTPPEGMPEETPDREVDLPEG